MCQKDDADDDDGDDAKDGDDGDDADAADDDQKDGGDVCVTTGCNQPQNLDKYTGRGLYLVVSMWTVTSLLTALSLGVTTLPPVFSGPASRLSASPTWPDHPCSPTCRRFEGAKPQAYLCMITEAGYSSPVGL